MQQQKQQQEEEEEEQSEALVWVVAAFFVLVSNKHEVNAEHDRDDVHVRDHPDDAADEREQTAEEV